MRLLPAAARTAALAAFALAPLTLATPARAAPVLNCSQQVVGKGHSHIAETREDAGKPRGGVSADQLARKRAIADWSQRVKKFCPHHSPLYVRAHDKKIECDAGAGNRDCQVSARPARKLLGWLRAPAAQG